MIDFISYYYEIYPLNIKKVEDKYLFYNDTEKYYLVPYERNIDELNELYNLNKQMIMSGSLIHEIILNKFDKILTTYKNTNYILLRVYVNENKKVTMFDITNMLEEGKLINIPKKLDRTNWSILWESKIDYAEYQMGHMIKKYLLIYNIIDYYIGLSENANSYLKEVVTRYNGELEVSIAHKRIGVNSNMFDLYNPLNLIIDFKIRDIAEYLKSAILNDYNVYDIYDDLADKYMFDKLNLSLLVSRLLFPTYFFDEFEKIIFDGLNESNINKITKKSSIFEDFINTIIKTSNLQSITWLNN